MTLSCRAYMIARRPWRRGVTLLELMVTVVILAILVAMALPRVGRTLTKNKVNQAQTIVAADLEQALSLAARGRRPIQVAYEADGRYTIRDRASSGQDTLRLRRNLALSSEGGARTVTFSPTSVVVFPTGTVSAALTITLTSDGYSRTVTLSPAGLVRVTPP